MRQLKTAPGLTIVIIGAGPIGIEMAQAHARLGVKVTVIEGGRSMMGRDHSGLVRILRDRLAKEGVNIIEGYKVIGVSAQQGRSW